MNQKKWNLLSILILTIIIFTSITWISNHPYGSDWDEAEYINLSYQDFYALKNQNIYGFMGSILKMDPYRPPGHRLLSLPIFLLSGISPIILRLGSLVWFAISLLFLYFTAKRLSSPSAGALTVIFLALSPMIVTTTRMFYTESALYLAISATLYFLCLVWDDSEQKYSYSWIGLGIAIGLGGLTKLSFFFIIIPMILSILILYWFKIIESPSPKFIIKSLILGFIIFLPWYILNFKTVMYFLFNVTATFARHSSGDVSLFQKIFNILNIYLFETIGFCVSIIMLAISITFIVKFRKIDNSLKKLILIFLIGTFTIIFLDFFTTNDQPRHLAPSLLPLLLATGILGDYIGLTKNKLITVILCFLFSFQITFFILPLQKYTSEQWNWEPLRQLSLEYNLKNPSISHLGNASAFNPPQIIYPWIRVNERVNEKWLWRYEDGEINWQETTKLINDSDIVLTIPDYIGDPNDKQNLDNQHNNELVKKLQNNSKFNSPLVLKMGSNHDVKIFVFIKKDSIKQF